MSLKAALQADLAAKGMKLGDLADRLGITQQSVSKWIAKDEIPKDRVEEVATILAPETTTARYLLAQAQQRLGQTVLTDVKRRLRNPPQPGDEDEFDPDRSLIRYATEFASQPPTAQMPPPPDYQPPAGLRFEMSPPPRLNVPPAPKLEWSKSVPIVGSAIDSARNAAMHRARVTNAWSVRLPPELQRNVAQAAEIQGVARRFEYLSEKVAVLVRAEPRMDPARLFEVAVPLMLLIATGTLSSCHLVLLPRALMGFSETRGGFPPDELAKRLGMVKRDLDALGVTVTELQTPAEVAEYITLQEQAAVPLFSYDEYEDYEARGVQVETVEPAPAGKVDID